MSHSERRKTEATISFRVTPDEAALIEFKGGRHGLSAGQFAKAHCLSDLGLPIPVVRRGPPRDAAELRKLVGQIGKIGSNINQLAKTANTPQAKVDQSDIKRALTDLASMRRALASVLGIHDP